MKQTLGLRQSQRLTITPQLQQAIKLLQMSALELVDELAEAQACNPLLELDDGANEDSDVNQVSENTYFDRPTGKDEGVDYSEFDDNLTMEGAGLDDNYLWNSQNFTSASPQNQYFESDNEMDSRYQYGSTMSLQQNLHEQLLQSNLTLRDKQIADTLIQFIDERGYLDRSLKEVLNSIQPQDNVDLGELEMVLHQLQNFDPAGVAARTPQECLQLQLRTHNDDDKIVQQARLIVAKYLPQLARKDFAALKKTLKIDEQVLREAIELIQVLSPHPGYSIGATEAVYIIPDIVVKRNKGKWQAVLNPSAMHKLVINQGYQNLVKDNARNQEFKQMREQLQNAKWLLSGLEKRYVTILAVANEIVQRQQLFFDHGPEAMIPMVLRDIAEHLEVHESTISRATAGKYLLAPTGIYELKYFFSSQLPTQDGGSTSSLAIRAMIKKLVQNESQNKPISDNKISTLLHKQGVAVARRTVAKYREQMNIPPSSQRKCL